ncbi:AraC family transcriptional regulator [Arhodomonas sp. SL1]|uniref:AraC family transcriptional regulator n=1 Tax=Arhodomonas sp. SL1 TaxID=3425691 RepID=UPI003F8811FA
MSAVSSEGRAIPSDPPSTEAAGALLRSLEVAVEAFAVCDVRAGWRLEAPAQGRVVVHYALQGEGTLRFSAGGSASFAPGTVVLVPAGVSARVTAPAGLRGGSTRCSPARSPLQWLSSGGDPGLPRVLLGCGMVSAHTPLGRGLFDQLPRPVVVAGGDDPRLLAGLDELLAEIAEPGLGSAALSSALMKQCLIRVLRRLAVDGHQGLPLLRALRQPGLAAAVATMIEDPANAPSLEGLAERACMGRSTFALRFREVFGQSPRAFLNELRLQEAARCLVDTALPVKTVAARAGYRSRSHFSRAFKARYGSDPDSYRSSARG